MVSTTGRRRATIAIAALAAVTLTGCGGQVGASTADTTGEAAATEFVPATGGELSIYTWSDYFPTDLLRQFEEETGIKATIDFYENNESLITKLEASGGAGYDVVVPSDYAVKMLVDRDLLRRIDVLNLPNATHIAESFRDPYFDPGRLYSAPYLYGTTSYAYDASLLEEGQAAPESWADYFDAAEPFAGSVGVFNDQNEVVNAALRAVGAPTCTSDPDDLEAARQLLLGFRDKVRTVTSDSVIGRLTSGENTMGMIWNGAAHRVTLDNPDVVYVYATEGISAFEDNWVVPSGSENVAQALTFINWMLEPEHAAAAANYQGYNAGITGIEEHLDEALAADPAIVVPDGAKIELVEACTSDVQSAYSQIWEDFTS